jgi:hypothetical protein
LIYIRSAKTGFNFAFDTGGILTEKPSLCVSFFIPKNFNSKSPLSWKITLSVEKMSLSSTPPLLWTDLGAMSEGRNMNANANKVITFKRSRFIDKKALSGQFKSSSLKGSLGKILTVARGVVFVISRVQ